MSLSEKVNLLMNEFLGSRPDIFVIENKISPSNQIEIVIDGDNGVTIQDCLDMSRAIENNLDREEEDFALSVSSAGIGNPLLLSRQYQKNIGRDLEVTVGDKTYYGQLTGIEDNIIELEWKERVPKAIGKGKEDKICKEKFNLNEIKKAIVEIKF